MNRNFFTLNYEYNVIPDDYTCDRCQAHGVRLWRKYETFANVTPLLCKSCAEKVEGSKLDMRSIGWMVPAIPIQKHRNTYWGFSAIPLNALSWWDSLPASRDRGELG